jgi:uncharacterized protein YkwD
MRSSLLLRRLTPALACLAFTTAVAPADAAPATAAPVTGTASTTAAALPCVSVPGVVSVNCPEQPATPTVKPKPKPCANATVLPDGGNLEQVSAATLCLLNKERTKRHLTPLRRQHTLDSAATRFARRLVQERFFDHTAPDGTTMLERIKATGYLKGSLRRWSVGENIAYGTGTLGTPKAIVKAWMRSPGHRANILDRSFREIGLGVHLGSPEGSAGATYVHDFGRRDR